MKRKIFLITLIVMAVCSFSIFAAGTSTYAMDAKWAPAADNSAAADEIITFTGADTTAAVSTAAANASWAPADFSTQVEEYTGDNSVAGKESNIPDSI